MDKFVVVTKSSSQRHDLDKLLKKPLEKQKQAPLYSPYDRRARGKRGTSVAGSKQMVQKLVAPLLQDGAKPSTAALTKHLLETLKDEANPITHSDIYSRTDYVTSAASGHQRSDGRVTQEGLKERAEKLRGQYRPAAASGSSSGEEKPLRNVKVYINGYLKDTTDIEMKRVVTLAGGEVLQTESGATHILTSQQLSGSKTQKLLTTRSRTRVHVVRPEWVTECIEAGKRLSERSYTVVKGSSTIDSFLTQRTPALE